MKNYLFWKASAKVYCIFEKYGGLEKQNYDAEFFVL